MCCLYDPTLPGRDMSTLGTRMFKNAMSQLRQNAMSLMQCKITACRFSEPSNHTLLSFLVKLRNITGGNKLRTVVSQNRSHPPSCTTNNIDSVEDSCTNTTNSD